MGAPSCDASIKRPAVSVEHFGVPLGVGHGIGPADDAVIRKQHRVVILDVGHDRLGKLRGSRRFVGRDCDLAHEYLELGNDKVGRNASGDGIRGGMRRMAVDTRLCLGDGFVDLEMQQYLAGARLGSGNLISVEVDHGKIFGR